MPQIVVENLVKTYRISQRRPGLLGALVGLVRRQRRQVRAVDGVDFAIERGQIVGCIGPNGAGKSTTVKILSGILVPDAGRVEVFGLCPWTRRIETVRRLGVVFGQRTQLWWDLPVIESYQLLRDIYSIPAEAYRDSLDELVELLDLSDLLATPVRQLSLGQRVRCDLAAALLHRPEIVFLDEPTIGLDAAAKLAVRRFIRRLRDTRGMTVLLTTHDMDDIEALCDRVLVIHTGRIFLDGTLAQLRAKVRPTRRITVDLAEDNGRIDLEGVRLVSRDGRRVVLEYDPSRRATAEVIAQLAASRRIRDLFVENPPIDQIVAQLYRGTA
jgi:ABC-2 type transport system ATP-binding protein